MTGDRSAPAAASRPPAGVGRWIRWPGVIVFAVVTALLAAYMVGAAYNLLRMARLQPNTG